MATINVTVTDVNDNTPVCAKAVYAASVAENVAVASSLVTVSCSDLDAGSNGEVCNLAALSILSILLVSGCAFLFVHHCIQIL